MKKITSFFVTFMMLVSFFNFTSYKEVKAEESNSIYISADGNDETGDGSESNPYKTLDKIKEVTKNTSDNVSVFVMSEIQLTGEIDFPENILFIPLTNNENNMTMFSVENQVIISNLHICNNSDTNKRLTLFKNRGDLIINNIIIDDITMAYGQMFDNQGNLTINNCNIHDNKAREVLYNNGGRVIINGGIFNNNEGTDDFDSYCSLIQNRNGNILINDIIAHDNTAYYALIYDGSAYVSNNPIDTKIQINSGQFKYNSARYGIIYVRGGHTLYNSNHHVLEINGGEICNNTVKNGTPVVLSQVETKKTWVYYADYINNPIGLMYINGGKIYNNTSYGPSAGVYIGPGSVAVITKCLIEGNTNVKPTSGANAPFSAGGIYNDGYLEMYSVAVVQNHSSMITDTSSVTTTVRGAGICTCPTSNNYIYLDKGLFVYDNTNIYGRSDIAISEKFANPSSFFRQEKYYISSHSSDGKTFNWIKKGYFDDSSPEQPFTDFGKLNTIQSINLYSANEYTQEELDEILENYDVIIMNNTSGRGGAGIGSNGTIVIGNKDEAVSQINISVSCHECITEQPEEINVTLYDKNDDKIRNITLLKSEDYTASVPGLADIQGYYVEQESLGEDFSVSLKTTTSPLVDGENGIKVRNINFELRNECITEAQGTTAKFKKYMVVDKNAEIPSSRFGFTITAGQGNDPDTNSAVVYPGVEPENVMINGVQQTGHVNFNAGENTVAGPLTGVATDNQKYAVKDITLDFRNVTFTEPGVYRYVLTENSNSNSAINNDAQPVRVIDVHIIWNDDSSKLIVDGYVGYLGNVTASPKLLPDFSYDYEDTDEDGTISQEEKDVQAEAYQEAYDAFIASIQDGSGKEAGSYVNAGEPIRVEAGEKSDKYVNNLETYALTLSKKVAGGQASRDEYFKFNVTVENAGSKTLMLLDMSNAEQSTHANNSTSYSVSEMNLKNNRDDNENILGNQIQANDSGAASFTVYLHHGQSIKLDGIPKNATYTITEDESPGYTTKSTNASGTIESDVEALFVNERGGVIPTGIFLSVLPALAVAGALIGVFILKGKSKKNEEE